MMESMDDVRNFLNRPKEYHPLPNRKFTDGFGNMLDAHSVVYELTAERDEWKRRCEAVVEMLQPAPDEKLQKMYAEDLHVEYAIRELYPLALAIAEGRDNG